MDIDLLIKAATLGKDGAAKEAYRAIKQELLLNSSSKKPKPNGKVLYSVLEQEITELDLSIIMKLVKQREDSISIYDANSRKDLADIERDQLKYLKMLLPPEVDKNEVKEFLLKEFPNGISKQEMGSAIKLVKTNFIIDGKEASEIVNTLINS